MWGGKRKQERWQNNKKKSSIDMPHSWHGNKSMDNLADGCEGRERIRKHTALLPSYLHSALKTQLVLFLTPANCQLQCPIKILIWSHLAASFHFTFKWLLSLKHQSRRQDQNWDYRITRGRSLHKVWEPSTDLVKPSYMKPNKKLKQAMVLAPGLVFCSYIPTYKAIPALPRWVKD